MSHLTNSPALIARPQRRRWLPGGLGPAVPALLLLFVFFVVPVVSLLLRSVLEPQPAFRTMRRCSAPRPICASS